MQFNPYNLYAMNVNTNDFQKKDKLDNYIDEIRDFEEYDDIRNYIIEHFGRIDGVKWMKFPENNKLLYICVDDDKVEVCALKNKMQYFGKGWKLIKNDSMC